MDLTSEYTFPLKTKREVMIWLNANNIRNYIVHDNLVVDVEYGGVDLKDNKYHEIPVQFGKVTGFFNCSGNQLTSLKGCPTILEGHFYGGNNNLTTLEYLPRYIQGYIYCSDNPIVNLRNFHTEFDVDFYHSGNPIEELKSLYTIDKEGKNTLKISANEFYKALLNHKLQNSLEDKILSTNTKFKI